jgi:hypothetical protein
MKYKPIFVAVALAVALLALSGPAAADHGSTHDIELYGDATYVDGTTAADQTITLVEANGDGTYTTLDQTTLTSDGEIANQSTGVGTPLSATVSNGTDLRLHLADNDSATEFPSDLIQITNQTGTYHVEAVFDTGQQISQYHSATLETDTGTVLASWDGSDYVDTSDETTTQPEPDPEPEPYWSYPEEVNESTDAEDIPDEEPSAGWMDWLFGASDTDADADDEPTWFDDLLDRLRGPSSVFS